MKASKIVLSFLLLSLFFIMQPIKSHAKPLTSASGYGGNFAGWPTNWIPINGLNDPDDSLTNERIDFVGDSNNSGAYYAGNSDYLFFRVRVDDGSAIEFADTIMILIDQSQDSTLDYGFMWDSKSSDQTKHGLELGIPDVNGTTWAGTRMDDADGSGGAKIAPPDFGVSNGDGYIRILNGQPTTNFGTTTLVDFAIKWSYLSTNTTLDKGQTWNIQLGSIENATDHNDIKYDVAGGLAPTDPRTFPGTVSFSVTAIQLENFQATNHDGEMPYIVLYGVIILLFTLLGSRALRRR